MYNDFRTSLLLTKCEVCKEEKTGIHIGICDRCHKKKKNFQCKIYQYKKMLSKNGISVFTNSHKNFKFTMPYIISTLFYFKIDDTKIGKFFRTLNLKEYFE